MGITMGVVFRPENIYTTVWCLYYMQGTLYPEGSVISRGLMGVFLLMSIYYFLKVLSFKRNHPVIKAFQYLAIMFGVYGLLRLVDATQEWKRVNDATTYFKLYEMSILPFFAYYYFAKTGRINSRWFYRISFLFLVTAIVAFNYSQAIAMKTYGLDEITNNAGYIVLSLLPIVVFLKKSPWVQYAFLVVFFMLVVSGMKRGAILALLVGTSYFVWESFKKAKGNKKLLYIFLGALVVAGGVMYFQYKLATSEYMQYRLEKTIEGDMSAREEMYPEFLEFYFQNATVTEYLLGYGADGTLKNVGDFAHQDWIETLMNQGFLGVFLLLNYWWALFMAAYRSYVKRYVNITNIIALFLIIYFTKTMVSMSINDMTIFSTSALAYALAAMDDALIRKDIND